MQPAPGCSQAWVRLYCGNGRTLIELERIWSLIMVVEIEGVSLHLAHPDEFPINWVGQDEVMRQLLAAWLVVDPRTCR